MRFILGLLFFMEVLLVSFQFISIQLKVKNQIVPQFVHQNKIKKVQSSAIKKSSPKMVLNNTKQDALVDNFENMRSKQLKDIQLASKLSKFDLDNPNQSDGNKKSKPKVEINIASINLIQNYQQIFLKLQPDYKIVVLQQVHEFPLWLRALCLPPLAFPFLLLFSGLFKKKVLDNYDQFLAYQKKDFDSAYNLWRQVLIQQKYKHEKRKPRRAWFQELVKRKKVEDAESLGSVLWIENEKDSQHNKDMMNFLFENNMLNEGKYYRLFLDNINSSSDLSLLSSLKQALDSKLDHELDQFGSDLKVKVSQLYNPA
ncbi:MAG: hypothetical protein KC646_14825 [Candidatus Cloacimonetes bacterium]|nr:hypothetical protein [Candidatus Cloacimonadota bacterium]